MKVSSQNKPVQTLVNKVKRNDILFTHKLQRREGVWSTPVRSLLIDSLLRGYLVNPVYVIVEEDKKQYVIDGVQRLSTISDYVKDEFALSKTLEPVVIDDKTFDIAGKKFSKLDERIRDELMGANIQVCEISNYTDKDVRELFRRLNGGKPLNTTQSFTPQMSDELSDAISKVSSHEFFEKVLTQAQLKSSVDMSIVLETLMLSEVGKEYDFGSFRKGDRKKFILYYNDKVNDVKIELIIKALDKLNEAFADNDEVKIPKTSMSVILYSAYRVLKDKKSFEKYLNILNDFLDNYDDNEEYKSHVKQGTSSSESVKFRLDYWRKIVHEL